MPLAPSFDRTVVSGGTGFIGRHLLELLVDRGFHPTAIAHDQKKIDRLPEALKSSVTWIELDLLDRERVTRFIETERPTVLFHLAGTRGRDHESQTAGAGCMMLNVEATRHLLQTATRAGAERLIITGTAEEYGNQLGPFDETRPLQPLTEYGRSKAEATRLALELYESEKCPVVVLRLFTVYGPYQPAGMFVSDAIQAAVNNATFSMSEGTQQRDLVFVNDVAEAMCAAASTPEIDGKVFNLGSGQPIALLDLARLIWNLSRTSASLNVGVRQRKNDDMQVTWADSTLARRCLGWSPKVGLETGLQMTIDWAASRI